MQQPASRQAPWDPASSMHNSMPLPRLPSDQIGTKKLVLQPSHTGVGMKVSYSGPAAAAPMPLMQLQHPSAGPLDTIPWGPGPPPLAPLRTQRSTDSLVSTHTVQHLAAPPSEDSEGDEHIYHEDRAAAAAMPRDLNPVDWHQLLGSRRGMPEPQQLLQALSTAQQDMSALNLAGPAPGSQSAAEPAQDGQLQQDPAGMDSLPQQLAVNGLLEGQDSADGLDLLMLVAQAVEQAEQAAQLEQAAQWEQQQQQQQHDAVQEQQPAAAALLAACASALDQAQPKHPAEPNMAVMQEQHAGSAADTSFGSDAAMHDSAQAAAEHASTDDASARDVHMRHAVAAALAAVESRTAGQASRSNRSQGTADAAAAAAGPSSRPKSAAAREADILRQVMLQEEALSRRGARKGGRHNAEDHIKSLEHAAQLQQQRQQAAAAALPPLPFKKRRSSSPVGRKRRSDVMGVLQPSPAGSGPLGLTSAGLPAAAVAATGAAGCRAAAAAAKGADLAAGQQSAGNSAGAAHLSALAQAAAGPDAARAALIAAYAPASEHHALSNAKAGLQAASARRRTQSKAATGPANGSSQAAGSDPEKAHPAAAASSKAPSIKTEAPAQPTSMPAAQAPAEEDKAAMLRAAADRPPRRVAAARASQQIAAGEVRGTGRLVVPDSAAPAGPEAVSGGREKATPLAQRSKRASTAAGSSKPQGPPAAPKATAFGRPTKRAKAAAAAEGSSSSEWEATSSSSDDEQGEEEYRAIRRKVSAASRPQQSSGSWAAAERSRFVTNADGVVVVAAKKPGPKGGRPMGAANKCEMQPRRSNADGQAAFGCRSQMFRGVYRCQRIAVRWRTQFSYARKVLNVGSFATEDDAARAWNAAAMHFRGGSCWVNPVEPVLPEDEGLAIAASLPQPEGGSLLPAMQLLAG